MDLNFPELNACKISKKIRKKLNYLDIPIIAITANSCLLNNEECFKIGINTSSLSV